MEAHAPRLVLGLNLDQCVAARPASGWFPGPSFVFGPRSNRCEGRSELAMNAVALRPRSAPSRCIKTTLYSGFLSPRKLGPSMGRIRGCFVLLAENFGGRRAPYHCSCAPKETICGRRKPLAA